MQSQCKVPCHLFMVECGGCVEESHSLRNDAAGGTATDTSVSVLL